MRNRQELLEKFSDAINSLSIENESNTPDFILSEMLIDVLDIFNSFVQTRDSYAKVKRAFMVIGNCLMVSGTQGTCAKTAIANTMEARFTNAQQAEYAILALLPSRTGCNPTERLANARRVQGGQRRQNSTHRPRRWYKIRPCIGMRSGNDLLLAVYSDLKTKGVVSEETYAKLEKYLNQGVSNVKYRDPGRCERSDVGKS